MRRRSSAASAASPPGRTGPCGCRGSIRFVHDDCLLRWLATRSKHRCEVCNRDISVRTLYAPDAPARLPVSEFMAALPTKLITALLLPFAFAACIARETFVQLSTFWAWRLAFARSFAEVLHLLSLRLSATSIVVAFVFLVRLVNRFAPFTVATEPPSVARVQARPRGNGALDWLQVIPVFTAGLSTVLIIFDMVHACILGFLPFSLGRITLWCISCFDFSNVGKVDSYSSTASVVLVGYGFTFSLGISLAGLHAFHQYLKSERRLIKDFLRRLPGIHAMVHWTFSCSQMVFRGIVKLITVANISLNLVNTYVMFGWLLDIYTSKMFGATMSQRFKLVFASSFASTAVHWHIGNSFLDLILRSELSRFLHEIVRPGVTIPFVQHDVELYIHEPFYEFYWKELPGFFVDTIFTAMVILVPIQIVSQLTPKVFPLDITYFNRPTKGTSFWQASAELLSGVSLLRLLIFYTLMHLGWLVKKGMQYCFAKALGLSDLLIVRSDGAFGHKVGNNAAPEDKCVSSNEAKDKRKFVAVRIMLLVMLAWFTVVIFNTAALFLSISVGRALLFAIPQLPVAGGLMSDDLFALGVVFCIISTTIAARDIFAYMIPDRIHLLALKSYLLLFIWIIMIPLLIGLLVDLLLISPFIGPDDGIPVLDFFCTLFLGRLLLKFWTELQLLFPLSRPFNLQYYHVHWTKVAPSLAYFIDVSWDWKLTLLREDRYLGLAPMWFLQYVLMPIITKLVAALGVPYVLAKGVFPRFGYSVAVNSAVYRFAWFGILTFCVLCYLTKVFCGVLHDSIRDERYVIGQRLENSDDSS